jgi:peptidoglycan hydrolase-like protein with peptidoglycan-binding domain
VHCDSRGLIKEGFNQEKMYCITPIRRCSWQSTLLSLVLCFGLQGFAASQTDTSSAAKKPSSTTKTGNAKTKTSTTKTHSATTGQSTSKKTSPSPSQKSKGSHGGKHSKSVRTTKKRGQQAIDGERARAIQEALIREHYMQGEPTGTWDSSTQSAMQRYQADHGWQSKTTPDSRALIKLGLGPSHDHLLNPESAMTSAPSAGDPKTATKAGPSESNIPQQ